MRVFYAFTSKSKKIETRQRDIINFISRKGHTIDSYNYILSENIDPESEDKSPEDIIERIKLSDIFIGEMGRASQTLGFLLSFAALQGKPSLYLYPKESSGKPGNLIFNNPSRLITVKSYTKKNIDSILSNFIDRSVKKNKSTRTTFISTIEIDNFINEKVNSTGLSKGEIIRSLLELSINKKQP